ncbi:hypothetical protein CU102_22290 [Phyllobacterium brassicacearum]|uniref:Uncharacterized protein n=2 Tax=Phyllobacterium brassicacearum TaxID=314235 RepID=A0A2P7BCS9_9HYPH|nr:hypothetical protein [Phyllobacterium brassicacearum]PSH64258.1 hypothetical protein CU102_22290 [Phyllobacterium brassicacearum]
MQPDSFVERFGRKAMPNSKEMNGVVIPDHLHCASVKVTAPFGEKSATLLIYLLPKQGRGVLRSVDADGGPEAKLAHIQAGGGDMTSLRREGLAALSIGWIVE